MSAEHFLNKTGLAYLWSKIKAYVGNGFASKASVGDIASLLIELKLCRIELIPGALYCAVDSARIEHALSLILIGSIGDDIFKCLSLAFGKHPLCLLFVNDVVNRASCPSLYAPYPCHCH